jgi:hypothetical protein
MIDDPDLFPDYTTLILSADVIDRMTPAEFTFRCLDPANGKGFLEEVRRIRSEQKEKLSDRS